MDLELDADQIALVETVRAVLQDAWPVSSLRALADGADDDGSLWSRLVALDWPALCVPEVDGGIGYGPVEAVLVHEACGASVVPGPLLATTALFGPLVRAAGNDAQRARLLGGVADGSVTGSAALTEIARSESGAHVEAGDLRVVAVAAGDTWRLDGTARSVIEGHRVDRLVVPAQLAGGEGIGLFVVDRRACAVTAISTPDASRHLATVRLEHVEVDAVDVLGRPGSADTAAQCRRAVDEAVTTLAAELVGTCTTILDMTLDHVKNRQQFDVAIGSFQAIKHRLADCYLALEAARATVLMAATAVAEDDPRSAVAASTAKALAGDCAALVTTDGIQMLGGLGFTWEHDIHLYVKRAMASSVLLGTAETHRQRTARLLGLVGAIA